MFTTVDLNRKSLRTGYKPTVFPQWEQTFEVDATYAELECVFNVYDYDGGLQNEHLGRAAVKLSSLPFKEKEARWLQLTDKKGRADRNLGELLVEFLWYPKVDTDELVMLKVHGLAAQKLQTWWRGFFSKKRLEAQRKVVEQRRAYVEAKVIVVQSFLRTIGARYQLRRLKKRRRLLRKLGRAFRRFRLMRRFLRAIVENKHARIIQCHYRSWRARKVRRKRVDERNRHDHRCISNMQKRVRRLCARHAVERMRQDAMVEEGGGYLSARECLPIAPWIGWYGTAPGYPSKRVKRICRKATERLMSTPYTTVRTNPSCPPRSAVPRSQRWMMAAG